jgi:hypothetical protein
MRPFVQSHYCDKETMATRQRWLSQNWSISKRKKNESFNFESFCLDYNPLVHFHTDLLEQVSNLQDFGWELTAISDCREEYRFKLIVA